MANPKQCPRCGTLARWEFGIKKIKRLPNGKDAMVTPVNGLRCPGCGHIFRHPAEAKALNQINDVEARGYQGVKKLGNKSE